MGVGATDEPHAASGCSEYIEVVFACDERYAKRLGPLLRSIVRHSADAEKLRFHLISSDLSKHLIDRLRRISPNLSYVEIECGPFSDLPRPELLPYVTKATYYRFMIGQCLPDVDRVIYIDADTCFMGPVEELWNIQLDGAIIGAVGNESHGAKLRDGSNLGFGPDQFYFNAGMLVVDLARWRKEGVETKLWNTLTKHAGTLRFADQDVLNGTLKGRVKELPKTFNVQIDVRKESAGLVHRETVLLHFVGRVKPWSARCVHHAQGVYLQFTSCFFRLRVAITRTLLCLVDYEYGDRFVCFRIFRIPLYKYKKKFLKENGLCQITHYCLWIPVRRSIQGEPEIS